MDDKVADDWESMRGRINELHSRLTKKPDSLKMGYALCPGGILNAYRECDITFDKAVMALNEWASRQAQEAPRGYDLENQKAENLGSWRLPLEAQEAPKAEDLQEVIDDYRRLTRELDVALNGDGSAKQASLCDIVAQVKREKEAPKAESQSAEDDFGPVNLNDEEPDKLKAAREARAWIDGILCQCDTTVDHVCDRCVLIRSIDKALSALDEGRKG